MRRCVAITGASRGIGRELALVFAENGYDVVAHGLGREALRKLSREIAAKGRKCFVVVGDVNNERTVKRMCAATKRHGASVFINNAGTVGEGSVGTITSTQIERVIKTNLIAPIKLTNRIYPLFRGKRRGTIVNMNSVSGLEFQAPRPAYCASKWGLRGFSGALKREAAGNNVRVIDVYPSRVRTRPEFTYGMDPSELAKRIYRFFAKASGTALMVDRRPKKYKRYV